MCTFLNWERFLFTNWQHLSRVWWTQIRKTWGSWQLSCTLWWCPPWLAMNYRQPCKTWSKLQRTVMYVTVFCFIVFCTWNLLTFLFILAFILEPKNPETQHGAVLALGYMVGRYMGKKNALSCSDSTHNKGQKMSVSSQEGDALVSMATKTIGMIFFR